MSVNQSFLLFGIIALSVAIFGVVRYRTPLNPLSVFAAYQGGLITIVSGVVSYNFISTGADDASFVKTTLISIVFLLGGATPYLFRGNKPAYVWGRVLTRLGLTQIQPWTSRFNPIKLVTIIVVGILAFLALMVAGGGGTLWFTQTRYAYQLHRTGAGPFFAMVQWCMTFAYLYVLWGRRPVGFKLIAITLVFAASLYFTGSKSNILTIVIIGIAYQHFRVKAIKTQTFFLLALFLAGTFMALQFAQGTAATLLEGVQYFDYFAITVQFISRFDEFGYYMGRALVSELWFLVPRGLYPAKPYEYGVVLIAKILYPGSAEMTHTPGTLGWSRSYLDFGIIGVYCAGMWGGILGRATYEYYLSHRTEFYAFIFMMQMGIWSVWWYSPLTITLALCFLQGVLFRLVLVRRPAGYYASAGAPAAAPANSPGHAV